MHSQIILRWNEVWAPALAFILSEEDLLVSLSFRDSKINFINFIVFFFYLDLSILHAHVFVFKSSFYVAKHVILCQHLTRQINRFTIANRFTPGCTNWKFFGNVCFSLSLLKKANASSGPQGEWNCEWWRKESKCNESKYKMV